MRTKLSIYNTASAMLLQVVNIIVNFILPKILIPEYGSAANGLVTSIRQLLQYFNVVEGGLAAAATYALYKPLAERNKNSVNGILAAANKFYNISGFIFSALVLLSTFLYPAFVAEEGISPVTIALLVLVIGASGSLEYFAVGKYKVLYTADQKSYVISLINAVAVALNSMIIIVLVMLHFDIVLVQLIALSSFFIRSLCYVFYARLKYPFINFKAKADIKALDKRWDSLILQVLGAVTVGTPIIVITFSCGLEEVSVYTVYNIVFAGVMALLSTFNNGLCASFGDMLAKREIEAFQRAYKQYEHIYYALLGWAYACSAILIMPFIRIFTSSFTDADYIRPEVAWLFVFSGLLFNMKTPQGMLVISAGLYKETKYQSLLQAVINIVVSVALAPYLGIAGVLIGSVVSNLYRTIDLIFYIPKVLTKLPAAISIRRVFRLLFLFAVSVFPAVFFLNINASNYFEWVIWAFLTALWCLFVFAIGNIIIEKDTSKAVILRFKSVFRK